MIRDIKHLMWQLVLVFLCMMLVGCGLLALALEIGCTFSFCN